MLQKNLHFPREGKSRGHRPQKTDYILTIWITSDSFGVARLFINSFRRLNNSLEREWLEIVMAGSPKV